MGVARHLFSFVSSTMPIKKTARTVCFINSHFLFLSSGDPFTPFLFSWNRKVLVITNYDLFFPLENIRSLNPFLSVLFYRIFSVSPVLCLTSTMKIKCWLNNAPDFQAEAIKRTRVYIDNPAIPVAHVLVWNVKNRIKSMRANNRVKKV